MRKNNRPKAVKKLAPMKKIWDTFIAFSAPAINAVNAETYECMNLVDLTQTLETLQADRMHNVIKNITCSLLIDRVVVLQDRRYYSFLLETPHGVNPAARTHGVATNVQDILAANVGAPFKAFPLGESSKSEVPVALGGITYCRQRLRCSIPSNLLGKISSSIENPKNGELPQYSIVAIQIKPTADVGAAGSVLDLAIKYDPMVRH